MDDHGALDQPRELQGISTPPHSLDDSPSMANRRRARPFSMLAYSSNNTNNSQPNNSPSPLYPEAHSRNASFGSAPRPLAHPVLGTPSKRPATRWTVIIIPPALLPHSPPPPHVSGFAHGYGASGRYSAGLLLPLQATLTLQLASIAREFSLPSTGGLSLHLSISAADQPPIPGPRVTDESWSVLFGWAFEDSPPACTGLQASTGLPIAGRLEFDIDLKKARWFDAWAAASQPSNRSSTQIQHSLKLTSTNFIPGLPPRPLTEQPVASSSTQGVRTLITSARRGSAKSSATDDSNKQLPNGHPENLDGQPRSPASIKSTQASPSRYVSGSHDAGRTAIISPVTISSAETYHRQQLERLVESEELSAAEEDNWHIQQETMLRQATLEREQIELAEQLEDEQRIIREEQQLSLQAHEQQRAMSTPQHDGSFSKPIDPTEPSNHQRSIESASAENPPLTTPSGASPSSGQQAGSPNTTPVRHHKPDRSITVITSSAHSATESGMTSKVQSAQSRSSEINISNEIEVDIIQSTEVKDNSASGSTMARLPEIQTTVALDNPAPQMEVIKSSESIEAETRSADPTSVGDQSSSALIESDQNVCMSSMAEASLITPSVAQFHNPSAQSSETVTITATEELAAPTDSRISRSAQIETSMARSTSASVLENKPEARLALPDPLSRSVSENTGASLPTRNLSPESRVSKDEAKSKHLSEPLRHPKSAEGSSFSPSLGRSVNRFSGEQELIKRRLKTAQGDEETQKMIDEMNRLVNEKAMAKEALIRSNPSIRSVRDDEPVPLPPVKETPKVAPPPPTRSKVIQLAKSFGSSEQSPSNSAHSSPKGSTRTLESSPTIPPLPLPPPKSEPNLDFLAHSPVVQGFSSSHSTPHFNARRSIDTQIEPLPAANPASKSTPSSVTSSPATRSKSLFKPRLSLGNNLLSSIFGGQSSSQPVEPDPLVVDPLAPILHCYETPDGISHDLSNYIVSAQDQALKRHQKFIVAISGGSLPKLMAAGLIDNPKIKWETWKVFFADERIVPLDHPDSNFANVMEALFDKVPIDRSQLVSIMGLPPDDIDGDEMAPVVSSIYMAQVLEELDWSADGDQLPRFDLILLGMGPDGHVCSLFPSHKLLNDEAIISWCNDSPKPPAHRITMTLPVLNAAHELAFVCAGPSKGPALADVLDLQPSATRPASLVKLPHKPVVWFVDQAAAAKTQYPRTTPLGGAAPSTQVSAEAANLGGLQLEGMEPSPIVQAKPTDSSGIVERGMIDDRTCRTEDEAPASPPSPLASSFEVRAIDVAGFGYPHSLRVYPAVYPYIDQMLYCPAPPIIEVRSLSKEALCNPATLNPVACIPRQEVVEEAIEVVEENCEVIALEREAEREVISSECQVDLDEVVESEQVVELEQVKDLDQTIESERLSFVYPHLGDLLYAPLAFTQPITPPRTRHLSVSPPAVCPQPDLAETSMGSQVVVAPQPEEQAPTSCPKDESSFGYPYNLIVYRAVYPYMEDLLYPPLPPRLSASLEVVQVTRQAKRTPAPFPPFSAQVNGSRGIAYQLSPGPESMSAPTEQSTKTATIAPKSPVAAMQTTLSGAFHSPSQPSLTPTARLFTPSLQYSQLDSQGGASLTPAVSPLALRALPSTLQQEYYGELEAPHSQSEQETDVIARSALLTSPVAIIPSHLPQSFYPTDRSPASQSRKIISPSLPFTHPVAAKNEFSHAVPAAALKASPSALGFAFFGGAAEDSTVREIDVEVCGCNFNEEWRSDIYFSFVCFIKELRKPEEESREQVDVDGESEGSCSHFSKGNLSMNSQTTLHQLTDDDWPPTPPSPDRLPSPDLMSRLATTPSVATHAKGSTDINTIQPQFPDFKSHETPVSDQSSSMLIESDQEVCMSSMAEASMITPSVAQFLDQSVSEIADVHPEDLSEFHAESTPRASAQPQLEMPYELSTSPENIDETQLDFGPLPGETQPHVFDPQVQVSRQQSAGLTNGLGLELGETVVKSDEQATPTNPSHASPQDAEGNQKDVEGSAENGLVQSSGSSECQMNSLRLLGEMDVDDMVSEISPLPLASPPLMERLLLTPCASPSFAKQFPAYDAALTADDEESFLSPPKIEADWHIPQVSLSEASAPSPPRTLPLALNLAHAESSERDGLAPHGPSSAEQTEANHSPISEEEESTPTAPILEDLAIPSVEKTTDVVEQARSDSPFFLDQAPGPASQAPNNPGSSAQSSPTHALTVDAAVPVERGLGSAGLNQQSSSRFDSPIFPPLNLTMDLSDPLSAATTDRSGIEDDIPHGVESSPSEQSSFEHQSNGFSLDRIRELSGQTPVTDNSEEVDVPELPSITKRPPTPPNNDLEVQLESVAIDEATPAPPSPILLPFQDLTEISEALGQFVFEAQEVAIQRHGKFQLALGGSILPQILGEGLVGDDRIRWERWEIFLVEEAIAPLGSPQSVLSALTESIIQHVPIPRSQVHSIAELTEADIEETKTIPEGLDSLADSLADEYENRLIELFPEASHETGQPPEFDLILISVGEEGQVGSLYPSHPMLGESNWFVAWLGDAWDPPSHRITLTLPVLNAARQFAFLAVGTELAEIVSDGLDRSIQSDVPMEEDRVNPTALVKSSNLKPVVWFTDLAAAALTDYPKSAFWDEP
ncbi:hypothetical protein PTTG_01511 [Puccinia triticina 1-1 BBBD Race 1]|uniref:6-phosphogluconolactonase n=1 Tax=Puccinia triticina (isolate 1-1 / race 1 (BBBD)) TaxID=630390 RepID=A0A180G7G2_PUCT1|nr:hypothetical protein PTTG_01511 [Puccinia triticina 1-1 BBBD Race 1]